MLRVAVGDPSYQIRTGDTGVEWLRIPSYPKVDLRPSLASSSSMTGVIFKSTNDAH